MKFSTNNSGLKEGACDTSIYGDRVGACVGVVCPLVAVFVSCALEHSLLYYHAQGVNVPAGSNHVLFWCCTLVASLSF